MSNVVPICPPQSQQVTKVHRKFIKHVATVRGIEVHIAVAEDSSEPRYIVVLWEIYDCMYDVFWLSKSASNALEIVTAAAERIHTVLMICQDTWVDRGLMAEENNVPDRPG